MDKKIIYQVLPRFWENGKFSGWDKKSFKYLETLGITHIWYTGIIRHASGENFVKGDPGCPYAIQNYYDVNGYLADNESKRMAEFEDLVKRTHKAGFKVLIDFVPNHVARNYSDEFGGIPQFDHYDYDWSDTRKINYSDPSTWKKMLDIVTFWAKKGVDGMRCDMVELVGPKFFGWLTSNVRKEYPDFLFVAEVYDRYNYASYINEGGFDLLYDKSGIYDSLRAVLTNDFTVESLTWNWQSLGDYQENMLNFLENHDEQRFASAQFAGCPEKGYAAIAVAALFNKASFMLYAGQEVGESASDTSDGRTSIFNWTKVNVLDSGRKDVLEKYRKILSYNSLPAFRDGGNWDLCYCNVHSEGFDRRKHFAFLRFDKKSCYLVVCNFSDISAEMEINIPVDAKEKCHPSKDSISVKVGAYDAVISKI